MADFSAMHFLSSVMCLQIILGMVYHMRKEEFYYDSRDNSSQIHAVRWLPDSENVAAVVQIVHGMAEYVERYEELAEYLTDRNFVVTGEDHLGHGKSISEAGIKGYFCKQDPATVLVRDVHRLKKMTQDIYPGVPYFLMGHSMGSYIARNYMSRYGTGIDGVLLLGTGMQSNALLFLSKTIAFIEGVLKGQKHISRFIHHAAFNNYCNYINNPKTPYDWLTTDAERVDAYVADKECGFVYTVNGFQTLFTLISRCKKPKYLKSIPKELPVFMASGAQDPVGGYGRGVKKAYQSLKKAGLINVELTLYPDDRHELFNELDREIFMQNVVNWLSKYLVIPNTI